MKKAMRRLLAAVLALSLVLAMGITAGAEENVLPGLDDMVRLEEESVSLNEACSASAEFSAADNAGVFVLKAAKGTDVACMGAFLVETSGRQYLLSHIMAAAYAQNGYELTLMAPGGTNHMAVCVSYDTSFGLSFLFADGMNLYNPLTLYNAPFTTTVCAGLGFTNDEKTEAKRVEYRSFDFSKWTQLTESTFLLKNAAPSETWVGAPIFPNTKEYKVQGMGTFQENEAGDVYMVIQNFEDLRLPEELSLAAILYALQNADQGDGSQGDGQVTPETKPAQKAAQEEESNNTGMLIICGVLVAAVAYYLFSNNRKKDETSKAVTQPAPAPVFPVDGATLPLDPTVPVHTHAVTRPMSDWQLCAAGGPLNGQSFPIGGTMQIGRGSKCDIHFPDNTAGISGSHCEISASGDQVILRDLGSTYGTFVNGNRITAHTDHRLFAGDSFTLSQGGPSFRVERTGASGGSQGGPAVRDSKGKEIRSQSSGKLTFGRNSSNTVQFSADSGVSANHCVVYREGGKLYLKDLGSTNGTFFSEKERLKPNTPYRLRKGMSFFLCAPKNTYVVTEE